MNVPFDAVRPDPDVTAALQMLGKTDLLLAVHDASFPDIAGESCGRGTPYGEGGLALARFARELGFTGLQMGPQGKTSPINRSPYDGSVFSRSELSLDLKALAFDARWEGLLSEETWRRVVDRNPRPDGLRVAYGYASAAYAEAGDEVCRRFQSARHAQLPLATRFEAELSRLWQTQRWVRDDAVYDALMRKYDRLPWSAWPRTGKAAIDRTLTNPAPAAVATWAARRRDLERRYAGAIERYVLIQHVLLEQHRLFQSHLQAMGLRIYGDVQIGLSQRDAWSRQALLLNRYWLGAPPSRTNLEGQPWSYPVLNPDLYLTATGRPGPVLQLFSERLGKMLSEFDGLRLDHPHGLVCPWVYRADEPDPYRAVQNGARLFEAPDLPGHAALKRFAIVSRQQIDRDRPRYADDWVRELSAEQVDRYALIVDALMREVVAHGRRKEDILVEVLSTEPMPLKAVRERHGLGRFRVTQKANLDDPRDVYRSENAQPQDWVMVGNHDTPPIWLLVQQWQRSGAAARQAAYLAGRLRPRSPERLAASLAADPYRLAHAKVADLFISPARHVMIFFADLFGLEEIYNRAGLQHPDNWDLRVPPEFAALHAADRLQGKALNLHAALALALRARADIVAPDLIERLERRAGWRIDAMAG